jgi:hypothetical protein
MFPLYCFSLFSRGTEQREDEDAPTVNEPHHINHLERHAARQTRERPMGEVILRSNALDRGELEQGCSIHSPRIPPPSYEEACADRRRRVALSDDDTPLGLLLLAMKASQRNMNCL